MFLTVRIYDKVKKYSKISFDSRKNEIADFHEKNPGTSIRKLAKIFTMKFDVAVAKSSVHKILKILINDLIS